MSLTSYSPKIWSYLNGLICVYKPAGLSAFHLRQVIVANICKELNELQCRPPKPFVRIEPNEKNEYDVIEDISYSDHPLVVGPRYQMDDMKCSWANYLGKNVSGVFLLGINNGTKFSKKIRDAHVVRVYKVKGRFGIATDNFFIDGKVVEKSTYKFIKKYHIERLLSSMESAHQKTIAEMCGLDLQTQEAYDVITRGLARPNGSKIPVIFNIKCTEFNLPNFTIEVHAVNEYQLYLMNLIHEIGVKLHSTAVCDGIKCIRNGFFTLEDALLRKYWWLQPIVQNLEKCSKIIKENENVLIRQEHGVLIEQNM